jgi:hypothetical protein
MSELITTLPPEIVLKVFRSVDKISTATRLSQTCRLMHGVWLANRSSLSMALVAKHRRLRWQPDRRLKPLWEHALEYETTRRGKFFLLGERGPCLNLTNLDFSDYNPTQDGFVTAKRILDTARRVRRTAFDIYELVMDYSEGAGRTSGEENTYCFKRLAPPIIARTLYTLLTMLDHHQSVDAGPDILYAVCRFVANHSPTLPWNHNEVISDGFPYLGELLRPEDVSAGNKYQIQEYEFVEVIYRIEDEYEVL